MKKVKFRTKYQYTGRRKNANLSRRKTKKDVKTAEEQQEEIGHLPSTSGSATAKKLEAFGISAEELYKPLRPSGDREVTADCYFFMQLSCLKDIMSKPNLTQSRYLPNLSLSRPCLQIDTRFLPWLFLTRTGFMSHL